jgi:multiple sugar transport system permease protein
MGPVRQFISVTLPMVSPTILFNVIALTIGTMQMFVVPYVITKAVPGSDPRALYFMTMYLYDNAFVYGKMGYASAQAWAQLLIILGLTGIMFWVGRRFVHYRGA